jgi:hypothetical protein
MTPPVKHGRIESQIVFPAPSPPGVNPDGLIQSDYSPLIQSALNANLMPRWCGVLIDRVCRFSDSEEPAFVHMRLLSMPIAGVAEVLVGHAYIARSLSQVSHLARESQEHLSKLTMPPTATCYGMAITGPGANYAISRMEVGTPLFVLRRAAEAKWPTGKSLILTSGWGPSAAEMGPLLREHVVPHLNLGVDDQVWWECSESL